MQLPIHENLYSELFLKASPCECQVLGKRGHVFLIFLQNCTKFFFLGKGKSIATNSDYYKFSCFKQVVVANWLIVKNLSTH